MNNRLITGMSFSAFNARYYKEGLISVSSFNNYTNDKYICFEDDMIYDDMEKNFEVDMIFYLFLKNMYYLCVAFSDALKL